MHGGNAKSEHIKHKIWISTIQPDELVNHPLPITQMCSYYSAEMCSAADGEDSRKHKSARLVAVNTSSNSSRPFEIK